MAAFVVGELLEPLLVSCSRHEDYGDWMFHLQQVGLFPVCGSLCETRK